MSGPAVLPYRNAFAGSSRLPALLVTILGHAGLVVALVLGARVVTPRFVPAALIVQVVPPVDAAPPPARFTPPKLIQPSIVVPTPDIVIAHIPTPVTAIAQPPKPVPIPKPERHLTIGESQRSYLGRLLEHLNRFKHYPPSARRAHIQGTVLLHFIMERDGRIIAYDIAASSGKPLLDDEARTLIQRAQPLPPFPSGFALDRLDVVVPIEFSLNDAS